MIKDIPYLMHESSMAKSERTNRRLWILCLVLIFALVATNVFWVYREIQYETYETNIEAQQDGEGVNVIGGGDIDYGTESKN